MSVSPSSADHRFLRVGIIHGGRLVEERVLAQLGDVTIGTSPRCTFIVPWDEVPRRWRLFEARGGRRILHLAGNMAARIADGAAVTRVDAGGGEPTATRPIALADRARGKVTLGDTTVLFQLLRSPPSRPRPQLPPSIRRRPMAEIDRWFALCLALMALLHVVVVIYLRQVDWPRRPSPEEIPDRFIRQMVRASRPPPPPVVVAVHGPETPLRAHPVVSSTARPARPPVKTRVEIEAEVRRMGLIPLLTARGANSGASLPDLLASGAVDRSLDEALRDVGDVKVASSDGLRGLLRPGGGSGKISVPGGLRGGTRIVDAGPSGPVVERDVSSHLKVAPPVVEGGHADVASITREIRSRRKAIAACYERALKQKPTLAGKLVVRFSIAAAGTVSAVDIDDDTLGAPEVGACVRALVLRWRFAPPAEAPVELSFPFLFQAGG